MEQEPPIAPAGLFTDPLSSKAPPGALRVAENVVIRRDGIIEPRPGFKIDKVSTAAYERAIPFNDNLVCCTQTDTAWYSSGGSILTEASAALAPIAENFRGAEARKNLYLPYADGVRRLSSVASVNTAYKAGGVIPGQIRITSDAVGTAVATTCVVRHRVVIKRTDASGNDWRGVPSNSTVYYNDAAGGRNPYVTYYFSGSEVAGDVIEIYRSANYPTGTIPDEELGLVLQYTITAADLIAGFISLLDSNGPTDLGAFIYTAPSQEGAIQENNRPPKCTDMCVYKGSMFYANTEGPQRVTLEIKEAPDNDQTGEATGVGRRISTGDTTNASDQMLNVAPTTGLAIGQLITGTDIPSATYIAAISGTTITMTKASTGTHVGFTFVFFDTIIIGTTTSYSIYPYYYGLIDELAYRINSTSGSSHIARSLQTTYYQSTVAGLFLFNGMKGNLVLESRALGASKWYIWGTHGEAYFPVLTGPTGYAGGLFTGITTANGIGSVSDDRANGLLWSKNNQPEHVPEINYAAVGSEKHDGLRVIATRDSMFIFKKDGIWRLTGAGAESGWRIDEFDLSTVLIRPDAAVEMNNTIYAWTNKGFVGITDAGITLISSTAIGTDLRQREYTVHASSSTFWRVYCAKNPKDNEVILSTGWHAAKVHVFNTKTLAWYVWSWITDYTTKYVVYHESDKLLRVFEYGAGSRSYVERHASDLTDAADNEDAVTITGISGVEVTIAGGSDWNPAVGAGLIKTYNYTVTKKVSSTKFELNTVSGLTTGAATGYKPIQSTVEWVVKTGGNEGVLKHFSEGGIIFNIFSFITRIKYRFSASLSPVYTDYDEAFTTRHLYWEGFEKVPQTVRFIVPANHARAAHLFVKTIISSCFSRFEMSGLSILYKTMRCRGVPRGDVVPST